MRRRAETSPPKPQSTTDDDTASPMLPACRPLKTPATYIHTIQRPLQILRSCQPSFASMTHPLTQSHASASVHHPTLKIAPTHLLRALWRLCSLHHAFILHHAAALLRRQPDRAPALVCEHALSPLARADSLCSAAQIAGMHLSRGMLASLRPGPSSDHIRASRTHLFRTVASQLSRTLFAARSRNAACGSEWLFSPLWSSSVQS